MNTGIRSFFSNLRKKKIIEILAAFIAGGWLFIEFVHFILIGHYHFPEKALDLALITLFGILICILIWRWFSGREAPRKFKLELYLIPFVALIMIFLDINLLLHLKGPESETLPVSSWKNSVAILPFVDMSPQKDQESFCDGMTEDLINRLTNLGELKVPARTSAFMFKGKTPDPHDVGEKLKVEKMLEGSVQKSGNLLRITTQLINVADGYNLWSAKYDREVKDIFAIQDEISSAIVHALQLELTSKERAGLTKRGTSDVRAYELYFKGKQFRYRELPKEMLLAKDCFEEAILIDSNYAAAYAGLADDYMVLGLYSVLPRNEAALKAGKAVQRALELDENSSEAHVSSGVVKMVFDWDWEGAERDFKQAITLNPGNFDAHREYSLLLLRTHRYETSEKEFGRCMELDPLNSLPFRDLIILYLNKGLNNKAEEINRKLMDIDPFWSKFSAEKTVEESKKRLKESGSGWTEYFVTDLAKSYYRAGNFGEASKLIKELEALYNKDKQGNVAWSLASYYKEVLFDNDTSLAWLERAVEGRAPGLIDVNVWVPYNSLRNEPRFQAVLKKVGLK
jgi:adenylate cyclase